MGKTLMEEFSATFLDPASCGSSVRWSVSLTEDSLYGENKGKIPTASFGIEVGITDCNKSINWSAHDYDLADKKLYRAIAELRKARVAIATAKKLYERKVKAGELRRDNIRD